MPIETTFPQGMALKRIRDGKTYNTETSIFIHGISYQNDWIEQYLFQTKHGAFFLRWSDQSVGAGGIKLMSDIEAQKWLEDHGASADLIERYFGDFPDGGASEVRITIRLPGNLYNRVVSTAENSKISVNTYIMRLLEKSESPNIE